jgi:hypothetical protein
MDVIKLPKDLGKKELLEELNARLKRNEVTLDWSRVEKASPPKLAALVAGLSLDVHADILGVDTVPEHLQQPLMAALERVREKLEREKLAAEEEDVPRPPSGTPAVFTAEEEVAPEPADPPPGEEEGQTEPPRPLLEAPDAVTLREELEDMVVRDLLGPRGGPEEELLGRARPRDNYILGILVGRRATDDKPAGDEVDVDDQEELAVADSGGDDNGPQESSDAIETMRPSSLGLSFCVGEEVTKVQVTARWGRYERRPSTVATKEDGSPELCWKRTPVEGTRPLELVDGKLGPVAPTEHAPHVVLRGICRTLKGQRVVSLFLVNEQTEPKRNRDEATLFQPELVVEGLEGAEVFRKRALVRDGSGADPLTREEAEAMDMLYRHHVEFAVGHGVAVHAEPVPGNPERAARVATRVVPSYEVPVQDAPGSDELPGLKGLELDMKTLSELDGAALLASLEPLAGAYEDWIDAQEKRLHRGDDGLAAHREAGAMALERCRRTLARLREGLTVLREDTDARLAFRMANRAMWLQRTRSLYSEKRRRAKDDKERLAITYASLDEPRNRTWRPFQLAFVLLNVPSLARLDHPERGDDAEAVADLLWFPTGGGKTEAYLGVAAFTLFIRRLQGVVEGRRGDAGISVLMRYTLRVLTLQQFQRAAALLCACEVIRQSDKARWGEEVFRLGLWVGSKTTPNRTEDADEAIKRIKGNAPQKSSRGTPAQLTHCPWCGARIDPGQHLEVLLYNVGPGRTLTYCGDPDGKCLFSRRQSKGEGLPVLVVDEEIYRLLPCMLIATVDKFAQMPWNGLTQMLFGQVDKRCSRHGWRSPEMQDSDTHPKGPGMSAAKSEPVGPLRPPDLIIQDELHLISGPLGTLTGLYETAVDRLATWEVDGRRVRPKVIASTATVRRASEQVHQLFLRQVQVFPPHGLEVKDNFFARQVDTSRKPGRRYIGVCAPGRRLKGTLIRVYVAYLAAAQALFDKYGSAVDPWMTLVGYFMSLRELAGMRRMVDDDVRARLRDTDRRGLARRKAPIPRELTSRINAEQIPELLDQLEVQFVHGMKPGEGPRPIDVLLATNMISVGVDVKRLGLMVTAGQPKSTAEYIQATSRVGRTFPGLVCTVYNWSRPRDLSHYESFEHYHATFYKHVEALSVTPFSARALDRGLSALLVSLVRLCGTRFNRNEHAQAVTREEAAVQAAVEAITTRARAVTESQDTGEEVRRMLERRLELWGVKALDVRAGTRLGYRGTKDGATRPLLSKPEGGPWEEFTCLNSLRDVEGMVPLVLSDTDEGDGKEVW